ncbi:DUF368 domain-containing protein [Methanosphaera cuniculi]|uniref:DUF368 domain-containing protein n=1 Tax=Methanosphaera cuniculi TaxID=1077256 RepID=A0A2A2HFL6_9EURY|nr:DUF368 domain-containing protein [Methanosphaera cuniculi]PAV08033.1 hypothetical protein ASJ82_05140 [Methanosphaera cuniculi]PWL08765.1 hypothetical protein MSCUN_04790 [Methanosphaera cuniculi]
MKHIKDMIGLFLRGFLMGMCDIMPGISGGTIALITGIYDRLINAISTIRFRCIKPLLRGNIKEFKVKFLEDFDIEFFIPLGIGIAIAMVIMAGIINFLLNDYAGFTYSFFAGLILASIYILYKQLDAFNIKAIIITIIFTIVSYGFIGLNPMHAAHSLPILLISGFIAICAMLLPGVSGSSLLLLLDQYEYMINALHSFALVDIIVFIIGAVGGFMIMSRVIKYLLKNHKIATVAALIGIMLGSMRIPLEKILAVPTSSLPLCVVFLIIGMVIVLFAELKSHAKLI